MGHQEESRFGRWMFYLSMAVIGASIGGLPWIVHDAQLDAEVIARIEAEARARKRLTPYEYACIRQWAAGAYDHKQKPNCAAGTRELPATAMTHPTEAK